MYREETGIWNFQTSFLWLKPNLVANINFNIAEMLVSHMNEQCDLFTSRTGIQHENKLEIFLYIWNQ